MKKLLFISILLLTLLTASASALVFNPTSVSLGGNPGALVTNNLMGLTSQEIAPHIIAFTDGVLSLGTHSVNVVLPAGFTLNPSVTSGFITQIQIPSNQYAGTYSGNLIATSTTQPSVAATLPISLMVTSSPSATVNSPSFTAGRGITRTADNVLTVTNTGNTDLNSVAISVADLSDGGSNTLSSSAISFSPSQTSISYGTNNVLNVDITTNLPDSQAIGTYTGTITVNYDGQTVTSTLSITVRDPIHEVEVPNDQVDVGGENQARNATIQKSITLQNTGDYQETVTLALSGVDSDYNTQLSTTQVSLNPGQSQTITLTLTVADDADSGNRKIGNLQLTYNSQTESVPVNLEVESKLEIKKIETKIDSKSSSDLTSDGDSLGKDLNLGEEIEFEIIVENTYSDSHDSTDFKIEDIVVTIEPEDDDFDEVDNDGDEFYVKPNKDDSVKLTFNIPDQIDDGEYDFEITVEGNEKESGARHTETWTVTLTVQRDRNDVRITETRLGTGTLQCLRTTELRVTVGNFGYDDQDEAALTIYAPDLGINENVLDIFLSEDFEDSENDFTKTIQISLAEDFPAGTYPITIKAYRSTDKEMEQKIVNLVVEDCPEPEEPEDDTTVVITPPAASTDNDQSGSAGTSTSTGVVETVETSFTNSTAFILMLVGLNMVILLVILVLVFKFLF